MGLYNVYHNKPSTFLAMTGLTTEEFDALLPYFSDCFYKHMAVYCVDGSRRSRKYREQAPTELRLIEDKLFFILYYLKTNPLQVAQGALFRISQSKANLWIQCLLPLLYRALDSAEALPARDMQQLTFAAQDTVAPLYFHDGTERPIPRPCDAEERRLHYSGKKKPLPSKTTY